MTPRRDEVPGRQLRDGDGTGGRAATTRTRARSSRTLRRTGIRTGGNSVSNDVNDLTETKSLDENPSWDLPGTDLRATESRSQGPPAMDAIGSRLLDRLRAAQGIASRLPARPGANGLAIESPSEHPHAMGHREIGNPSRARQETGRRAIGNRLERLGADRRAIGNRSQDPRGTARQGVVSRLPGHRVTGRRATESRSGDPRGMGRRATGNPSRDHRGTARPGTGNPLVVPHEMVHRPDRGEKDRLVHIDLPEARPVTGGDGDDCSHCAVPPPS